MAEDRNRRQYAKESIDSKDVQGARSETPINWHQRELDFDSGTWKTRALAYDPKSLLRPKIMFPASNTPSIDGDLDHVTGNKIPTSQQLGEKQPTRLYRRSICLLAVVVTAVLIASAVVIPVLLLTKGTEDEVSFTEYKVGLTVDNVEYGPGMANNTSEEFSQFALDFCNEIDGLFSNGTTGPEYEGCLVTYMRNGSVIVNFALVFKSSPSVDAPTETFVLSVLSKDKSKEETVVLGGFQYKASSISINNSTVSESNPLKTVTCGQKPSVLSGKTSSSGNMYGAILTISCIEGYTVSGNAQLTCKTYNFWGSMPTCSISKCDGVEVPAHSIPSIDPTGNHTYGSSISFTCETGFRLDGESTIRCQGGGSWTPVPACIPLSCSSIEEVMPDNSNTNISTNITESTDGLTVKVTCNEGYEMVLYTTCSTRDGWVGVNKCEEITCQPFVPSNHSRIVNGSATGHAHTYGTKLTVTCDEGYRIHGAPDVEITCMANKQWSSSPECEPLKCAEPDIPNHAIQTDISNTSISAKLSISCIDGFQIRGDSEMTCLTNGSWSEAPVCERVDCGSVPKVEHTNNYTASGQAFEDMVEFRCGVGYEANGTLTATCTSKGQWTTVPDCIPVACKDPPVSHGSLNDSKGRFGDIFEVTCEQGYNLVGSKTIQCQHDGKWSEEPSCQQVVCNDGINPPEHGYFPCQMKESTFGGYLTMNCSPGYVPEGDGKIFCLEDGSWSNIPTCVRVTCPAYTYPANAVVPGNAKDERRYGDTITIVCEDKYTVKGDSTVTCKASGEWSDGPTCEALTCPMIDPPSNGNFTTAMADSNHVDAVYTIACDEGYEPVGPSAVTCLILETWSELPSCGRVKCPPLTIPEHSKLRSGDPETSFYNDVVIIECDSGYSLNGSERIECLSDRSWDSIPECRPVTCPEFDVPNNAFIIGDGVSNAVPVFNDFVAIGCNPGYTMVGNETIMCQADGTWNNQTFCEIMRCPSMVPIANGHIKVSLDEDREYNDSVQAVCDSGYESTAMVMCTINGTWDADDTCLPVDCGQLNGTITGGALVNTTGTTFGSQALFRCNVGYIMVGPNTVHCQANKTWEDSPPCLKTDCDAVNNVENGYIRNINTSTYEVVCNKGYLINGTSTFSCGSGGVWTRISECQIVSCVSPLSQLTNGVIVENTGSTFGSSISFECDVGYTLIGISVVECRSTGDWDEFPRCDLLDCGVPKQLVNGIYAGYIDTSYNSTLVAECFPGYEHANAISTTSCLESGNWSASIECVPKECPPLNVANGMVLEYSNGNMFASIARYSCNTGYQVGDGVDFAVCNASGLWDEMKGCRRKVNCGIPEPLDHGSVVNASGIKSSDTASVKCDSGYDLEGNGIIVCDSNGDGKWSKYPECSILDCGRPYTPANAKRFSVGDTTFGSTFDITCVEGFSRRGNDSMECMADGHWSIVKGCVIDCGQFEMVNGAVVDFQNGTDLNSVIRVRCVEGYYFFDDTDDIVRCMKGGVWQGDPYCIDKGPEEPYLRCLDDVLSDNDGSTVTTRCRFRYSSAIESLEIKFNDNSLYNQEVSEMAGNTATVNEIIVAVDTALNLLTFAIPINCENEGDYSVRVNDVSEDGFRIRMISDPRLPIFNVPSNAVLHQFTEFSCKADRGRDENGDPSTSLVFEYKPQDIDNYILLPEDRFITVQDDDTCLHITTLTLGFYPTLTYNNTDIRCALRSSANTSEQVAETRSYGMVLGEQTVSFRNLERSKSVLLGEPITLECFADNVQASISMSMKHDGEIIATLTQSGVTGDGDDYVQGVFENGNGYLMYSIVAANCSSKGEYTCHVSMQNGDEISTLMDVVVLRAPSHPELMLTLEMMENQSPWLQFPTLCEGSVGYPPGQLHLQSNHTGSYETLTGASVTYAVNDTECTSIGTLTFYNTYTMDWDGADIRCVVKNEHVYPDGHEVFVSGKANVIPESFCTDQDRKDNTVSLHPHACYAIVTCLSNRISPHHTCKTNECYDFQRSLCMSCGDKCPVFTVSDPPSNSSIRPAVLMCPRTLQANKGDIVIINCTLDVMVIDVTNLTAWTITISNSSKHIVMDTTDASVTRGGQGNKVQFNSTAGVTAEISSDTIEISIELAYCSDAGTYTVEYIGRERIHSSTDIVIPATANPPTLSNERVQFYRNQEAVVVCTGYVGNPPADLSLMSEAPFNIESYLTNSSTISEEDLATCGYSITASNSFYVTNDMDNVKLYCETTMVNGSTMQSTIETIGISDPQMDFGDESMTVQLRESVDIECRWERDIDFDAIIIRRRAFGASAYADVLEGIDKNIMEVSGPFGKSLKHHVDKMVCMDEGEYVCDLMSNNKTYARVRKFLYAKGTLEQPSLTLPRRLIVNVPTLRRDDYLNCTANLGYRSEEPYDIRIEYKSAMSGEYEPFLLGDERLIQTSTDDCKKVVTRTHDGIKFDSTWNGTSFRCVVYNTSDKSIIDVSEEQSALLINDHCDGTNDEKFYCHPYDRHMFIRCHDGGSMSVFTCYNKCAFITNFPKDDGLCAPCGAIRDRSVACK